MDIDSELRERYIQTQVVEKQLKEIQTKMSSLEEQLAEISVIIQDLEALKEAKAGDEILVPVHNGIFIRAKILDKDKLLVNVGANTLTAKPIDKTQKLLAEQSKEIHDVHLRLSESFRILQGQAEHLEEEVREVLRRYEESNV